MIDPMDLLIGRIKDRITDPLRASDNAIRVHPMPQVAEPVAHSDVDDAEDALGFSLPSLIRRLYTEVGNGGWGPGYGLLRLLGEESLVEWTLWDHEYSPGWPTGLVRFVEWGCFYASYVDCLHPDCPVIFSDNDAFHGEIVGPGDYLYPEAKSLAGWLSSWLNDVDLWKVGPKSMK